MEKKIVFECGVCESREEIYVEEGDPIKAPICCGNPMDYIENE